LKFLENLKSGGPLFSNFPVFAENPSEIHQKRQKTSNFSRAFGARDFFVINRIFCENPSENRSKRSKKSKIFRAFGAEIWGALIFEFFSDSENSGGPLFFCENLPKMPGGPLLKIESIPSPTALQSKIQKPGTSYTNPMKHQHECCSLYLAVDCDCSLLQNGSYTTKM